MILIRCYYLVSLYLGFRAGVNFLYETVSNIHFKLGGVTFHAGAKTFMIWTPDFTFDCLPLKLGIRRRLLETFDKRFKEAYPTHTAFKEEGSNSFLQSWPTGSFQIRRVGNGGRGSEGNWSLGFKKQSRKAVYLDRRILQGPRSYFLRPSYLGPIL